MACRELQQLDEMRSRLTRAFVQHDARLQKAAERGAAEDWARAKERLDAIEREWQMASAAVLEHRDRHGCLVSADVMPEHDPGKMQ